MPIFEYKGLDRSGRNVRNTIDAENARAARVRLKKDGVYVIELKDKGREQAKIAKGKSSPGNKKVNVEDLSMMTRQLATLLRANIPLVECLAASADQVENQVLKDALGDIKNLVNEGTSLHKALGKYPKIFSNIFITMSEAGEMSGTLDVILIRLAEFLEAQSELRSKVRSAMMYPIMMTVASGLMLSGLFIYVIPKISLIFEQADLKLPWYTLVIIGISDFLVNYWIVLLGGIFGFSILFRNWRATPAGGAQWDSFLLKLPVIGKLTRMVAVSRFTRTLSTLLTGGVPMLMAMDIVRNVVDNAVLAKAINAARDNISEGESVAGPLKKSGEFPPIVIHMINIGEKTGELEKMLTQVSDSYDFQVKNSIQGLTSLMEPIMIILMGVVIGIIVFAIMIPIFEMTNIAG
ncbi:MAG: type II secretion system inner membrane protein GspF [Bdellovibrionia bacterium]